jgi:hypothetical protein
MTRWGPEPIREERPQRGEAHPALMKRRHQRVAPPLGTSKPWHAHGDCLLTGLEKGRAEVSLSPWAYTLSRVVTRRGGPALRRALA